MTDIVIFIKIFKKFFDGKTKCLYRIINQKAQEKWDEFATKNDA